MPQFIAFALVGAGMFAGYRWAQKKFAEAKVAADRAEAELRRRAGEAAGQPRDLGRLELDPASGEYRPKAG
jgi:hypothetical protein